MTNKVKQTSERKQISLTTEQVYTLNGALDCMIDMQAGNAKDLLNEILLGMDGRDELMDMREALNNILISIDNLQTIQAKLA